MHTLAFFCLSVIVLCHPARGFQFGNLLGSHKHFSTDIDSIDPTESSTSFKDSDKYSNPSGHEYGSYNSNSEYRSDDENFETALIDGNISVAGSPLTSTGVKSESVLENSSSGKMETYDNESQSNNPDSTSKSPVVTSGNVQTGEKSTLIIVTPSSQTNVSSSSEPNDEPEGVVIGKLFHTDKGNSTTISSEIKTLYQRTMELMSDTYTLSILLPVAAGVVFASTIIVTIATCRCLRRRCRRSRLRRKVLPDSVKTLRPSDHARLLAESSDEEF